jgi:hypothetical protein
VQRIFVGAVVIEESATLTRPDATWTFGRYGVAIDGDLALVLGDRVVSDPTAPSGVRWDGVAYLYRRSGTQWNYQSRLGPSIFWDERMRGTLADPGFPAFATRVGLLGYWKTTGTKPDVCNEESPPPFCKML